MPDTELTVSHPIVITVPVEGLDFNGVVAAISQAAIQACDELLGRVLREVERRAQVREPDRWVNRGQATRRLRLPWGEVTVRRTRVRDRQTGRTYNLADRLLGLRPYVRRWVEEVRTACELAVTLPYRAACHWWQRLTGLRSSVMNFWRMVQQAGQRLVDQEQDEVGEIRLGEPSPRAVRRVYLEADGVWLRRQKSRRPRATDRRRRAMVQRRRATVRRRRATVRRRRAMAQRGRRPAGCCCTWERDTASCTRPAASDGTRWTSRCSWKLKIYGLLAANGLGRYSGGLTWPAVRINFS